MLGGIKWVSAWPGAVPAVPSAVLYQAGTVMTLVVFAVTRPQLTRVALVLSKIDICWPITVADEAVTAVAVTVPEVAPPPVKGDPVAYVRAATAGRVLP